MRDIKFRGKRLDSGEWVYGEKVYVVKRSGETHIFLHLEFKSFDHLHKMEVDAKTVGQCTGLKDKNGKEIYEGDILGSKGNNYLVRYEEDKAQYWGRRTSRQGFELWRLIAEEWEEGLHLPVIGNKHENPELLEETT